MASAVHSAVHAEAAVVPLGVTYFILRYFWDAQTSFFSEYSSSSHFYRVLALGCRNSVKYRSAGARARAGVVITK